MWCVEEEGGSVVGGGEKGARAFLLAGVSARLGSEVGKSEVELTSITQGVIRISHRLKLGRRGLSLDLGTGTSGYTIRMAQEGFALVGSFDLVLRCESVKG